MDYEELSRAIAKEFAKELGGDVPAEVEAKLMRGEARGLVEAVTVAGFSSFSGSTCDTNY